MIKAWGITDKGVVRTQNQDGYYLDVPSEHLAVGVVCDGMGGAKAGNIASLIAVETFVDTLQHAQGEPDTPPPAVLARAAEEANDAVYRRASSDPDCFGMGTTMVAVMVVENTAYLLNIGDSRAYLIDEEGMRQVTHDHSLVAEMVRRGELSSREASRHPNKNVITRALGVESNVSCDVFPLSLKKGQYVLLCPDGLTNEVSEPEIYYEVFQSQAPERACDTLIEIARSRGGHDNITVVLASF